MGDSDWKLSMSTALDGLSLVSFSGHEEMSQLFEFELEMVSEQTDLDATQIVGKPIAFAVEHLGVMRPFSGIVARFVSGGRSSAGRRSYRARVVPWLWLLMKRSNYRIFQEKTVLEIIGEVFSDSGAQEGSAYEHASVTGSYPVREYCVQFGETDFDFVSRLLEEEGIYYFFRFEQDKHVLVLADSGAAYRNLDPLEIEFSEGGSSSEQVVAWEHRIEFVSGKWSLKDYNFTKPQTELWSDSTTVVALPGAKPFERFEYPGGFEDKQQGDARAKARMEAEEAAFDVVHGAGGCHAFQLAGKFQLVDHIFPSEQEEPYVLTSLSHHASEGGLSGGDDDSGYTNEFRCIPSHVVFRPQRRTPRPRVPGPQTAIVVGPAGEEIHTDKYGRIKVQFHWDREGKYNDTSSCWIRVAQSTAGKEWGVQVLPRVKQEVVVEFIDGDPDRPIVTGALYNANTMPAYKLPENKTQSGMKSRSSKGAGVDAFNELRFEDKKGSEHIFIRAQKDEHHWVMNDYFEEVGGYEHRIVAEDLKEMVVGDHHDTLNGDRFVEVGGEEDENIVGDRKTKVGGIDSLAVGGDCWQSVGGDLGQDVDGSFMQNVGVDLGREAAMNIDEKAGQNLSAEAGMNVHIKGGMNVVIEAGLQLTLKVGGSFVVIGPAGVDISGPMVKVNSGGSAGSGSGASPAAPGQPVEPGVPLEPEEPMAAVSAAAAEASSSGAHPVSASELEWAAIETAEPTPQAAALESAAATGQPFCDT